MFLTLNMNSDDSALRFVVQAWCVCDPAVTPRKDEKA